MNINPLRQFHAAGDLLVKVDNKPSLVVGDHSSSLVVASEI